VEVLAQLPHDIVEPDDLKSYIEASKNDPLRTKKIVISIFASKYLVKRKDGSAFDKQHYYKNPLMYKNKFEEDYLPYVNFLVTGAYYDPKQPRVVTIDGLKKA